MTAATNGKHPETPTEEVWWQASVDRDERFRNLFVLAVRTTGIYCRPTCPARRPKRENASFFATPEEALQEVEKAKEAWLEVANDKDLPVPEPRYRPAIYQVT